MTIIIHDVPRRLQYYIVHYETYCKLNLALQNPVKIQQLNQLFSMSFNCSSEFKSLRNTIEFIF